LSPASKSYALEITNAKSDRHVNVAETGAFFVPAPGLSAADSLDGFESKERNIQVIVANFGAPLDEIAKGFTEEAFNAMGMELKSRGEFTVNGARALLFKVLHPRIDTNWGKWIMLAENGGNTLEVNAVFVSGDAEAASDLEIMLKGVYMEPPRPSLANAGVSAAGGISERPVSDDTPVRFPSENARAGETLLLPAARSQDVPAVSRDIRPESGTEPAPREIGSAGLDDDAPADLAKPAGDDKDVRPDGAAVSNDVPVSRDIAGSGAAVSSDNSVRKTGVRIITEDGIVSVENGSGDGENSSGE
jgi:hypothetical protein